MKSRIVLLRKFFDSLPEKLKFIIVGAFNSAFYFSVFSMLYLLMSNFAHYILILIIAHIIGVTNSFHTVKKFVFNHGSSNKSKEFIHYNIMYFFLLLINSILMTVLIEYFKLHAIVAQAGIIMTLPVLSYYWQKFYLFNKSKSK